MGIWSYGKNFQGTEERVRISHNGKWAIRVLIIEISL